MDRDELICELHYLLGVCKGLDADERIIAKINSIIQRLR